MASNYTLRLLATLMPVIVVISCAAPIRYQEAAPGKLEFAKNPSPLTNAVEVASAITAFESGTGPEKFVSEGKAHPITTGSVTSEALLAAARLGLQNQGWLAPSGDGARFVVHLALVRANTTQKGWTLTSEIAVRYVVSDRATKKTIFQNRLETKGEARISDPILGYDSGRVAVESAMRRNIEFFLTSLAALNF